MTQKDRLAEWIISHCHKTCGRDINVEKETALIEADEILELLKKTLDEEYRDTLRQLNKSIEEGKDFLRKHSSHGS